VRLVKKKGPVRKGRTGKKKEGGVRKKLGVKQRGEGGKGEKKAGLVAG